MAYVPLPPTLVGLISPLSSLPTKPASGELGAARTALGPEAQAFQAPAQPFGQTLLGARAPLLVRLETGAHGCHSRDRGPLDRAGFRLYWSRISRARRRVERKPWPKEVRNLIFQMVAENPTWGAPRIHGELMMLGWMCPSERSRAG